MPDTHSKIRLRRVSPLGAGLIGAAAAFLAALVGGGLFLIGMAAGMAGQGSPGLADAGAAGAVGFLIGAAIIYPIMGFIAGFLYAVIFNLVAPMIGGLELTVSGLNPETESEQVWKDV